MVILPPGSADLLNTEKCQANAFCVLYMFIWFCHNIYRFSNEMISQMSWSTMDKNLTVIGHTIFMKIIITRYVIVFCKALLVCCLHFFTSINLNRFCSNEVMQKQVAYSNNYFGLGFLFNNILLNKSDGNYVELQICYNLPQIGRIVTKTFPVLLPWQICYHDFGTRLDSFATRLDGFAQ